MTNYLLKMDNNLKNVDSLNINNDNSGKNGIINGIKINNFKIYNKNRNDISLIIDNKFNNLVKLIDDEIDSDDDSSSENTLKQIDYFKENILSKNRKLISQAQYDKYIKYLRKYSIIIKDKLNLDKTINKGR